LPAEVFKYFSKAKAVSRLENTAYQTISHGLCPRVSRL